MKYSKKTNRKQTAPLVKIISSLVAGVVIASLSASVTANQLNSKLQTPAQVEQALTALLDSREATLQLASYTTQQTSNSANQSAVRPAATKTVDHSKKSVAELILAGLAITSEAKDELSSSATTIEPAAVAATQDYAVADIVSVQELEATAKDNANDSNPNSEFNSNEPEQTPVSNVALVEAEIKIQADAQEIASISTVASNQVSSNINEPDEDALPAMPVSQAVNALIAEEQVESTESFAVSDTDETEIAETETSVIAVVEIEAVEAEVDEIAVVEIEAVEAEVDEIAVIETEAVEAEVNEIAVVETEAVEVEVNEIAVVETEAVEAEVNEITEVEMQVAEAEVSEEVAPSIVNAEESAPVELASVSTSVSATSSLSSAQNSVPNTSAIALVADSVDANVTVVTRSAGCPEDFNKVSIPVNGKLCQIFAADFPASMILFIPQTPEEVIQYYLASSNSFVEPKTIKQRTMLKSADNNTTLIISKDGGGTQVDILVKSPVI